jgi:hypothetical protein
MVFGTTSLLQLLLFPQLTLEYNKIGNVCINITLKCVHITPVAMERQRLIMHNVAMPYKNIN